MRALYAVLSAWTSAAGVLSIQYATCRTLPTCYTLDRSIIAVLARTGRMECNSQQHKMGSSDRGERGGSLSAYSRAVRCLVHEYGVKGEVISRQ